MASQFRIVYADIISKTHDDWLPGARIGTGRGCDAYTFVYRYTVYTSLWRVTSRRNLHVNCWIGRKRKSWSDRSKELGISTFSCITYSVHGYKYVFICLLSRGVGEEKTYSSKKPNLWYESLSSQSKRSNSSQHNARQG